MSTTEVYSFFHAETGVINPRHFSGPDDELTIRMNTPEGHIPIRGFLDQTTQRVNPETREVYEIPPVSPYDPRFVEAEWEPVERRWLLTPTTEGKWATIRAERDARLAATDWIVARAVDREEPVPEEWKSYRQQLRDVTLQPDPDHILWPLKP